MPTYAIGDIQGCVQSFRRLLRVIDFHPSRDRLWLAGDLVNRGPKSQDVLYDVMHLGHSAQVVLGNHDLHALSVAYGVAKQKPGDTLSALLADPGCMGLMGWLRQQPLMIAQADMAMVHAGVLPQWSSRDVARLVQAPEARLAGPLLGCKAFLEALTPPAPAVWRNDLQACARDVAVTKILTYLRICDGRGQPVLNFSKGPEAMPEGCFPWFAAPHRRNQDTTWVFGHWSQLGLHHSHNVYGLDTGCVWGHKLTALRLEDKVLFDVAAKEPAAAFL